MYQFIQQPEAPLQLLIILYFMNITVLISYFITISAIGISVTNLYNEKLKIEKTRIYHWPLPLQR